MADKLPAVPTGLSTALRNFLSAVSRAVSTGATETKSVQSLLTSTVAELNTKGVISTGLPSVPANVTAVGSFTHVIVAWDRFKSDGFSFAEIWRSTSSTLSTAKIVGTTNGNTFSDEVGYNGNYYYWVRFVSPANVAGAYSSPGVNATTAVDVTAVLDTLNEILKVDADRFTVVHPGTNGQNAPFIVDGNNVYMTNALIKDGSIQNAKIQSLAADKIYANSAWINTADITDLAVTNAKISDATITNAKIASATITNASIASGTITGANISGGTITGTHIASASVDTLTIAGNAVTIPLSAFAGSSATSVSLTLPSTPYVVPYHISATLALVGAFVNCTYGGSTGQWNGSLSVPSGGSTTGNLSLLSWTQGGHHGGVCPGAVIIGAGVATIAGIFTNPANTTNTITATISGPSGGNISLMALGTKR